MRSVCPYMEGYRKCNNYEEEGHFGKDYPTLTRVVARPPVQTPTQQQASGDEQSLCYVRSKGCRLR